MIHHILNASLVSGPERLVLPNLQTLAENCEIVLLQENRRPEGAAGVAEYSRGFGFTVHEFAVAGRVDVKAVRALRAFWHERRPRIAHAHGPKAAFHTMLALRGVSPRPWLLTTHHGVRAFDQSPKLRLFEALYEKLIIPRTDLCLTVCTSDRTLLIQRGVPAARLAVHLNGISRRQLIGEERTGQAERARQVWSRDVGSDLSAAYLVGVVGRLSPEKQHDLVLRAFARLRERHPDLDARLLCFGSGPLEATLARRTADLGLGDRVHWLGYRPDVPAEIAGLDVLLSASSAEGLPINLIEAGWAAVPVVANGVDGVRDLIRDGDTGMLLQPPPTPDAIAAALAAIGADGPGARRMADALQARVGTEFSGEAWTRRLLEIYDGFPARA